MIIQRRPDSKIKRNFSGEILAQSDALIDLRSTFGVTKDGSNLVSQVKLFNNPSQVIRDNGSNCVENGDGFDFTANTNGVFGKLPPFPDLTDWTFQFWFKSTLANIPNNNAILFYYNGTANSGMYAQINTAKRFNFYTYNTSISTDVLTVDLTQWNHFAIMSGVGKGHRTYVNGVSDGGLAIQDYVLKSNGRSGYIGNRGYTNAYPCKNYLDDIQLIPRAIYPQVNRGEFAFTPPKRSSE